MPRRKSAFTFVEVLVVIAVLGLLVLLLAPSVRSARGPALRNSCSLNLKQIGIALHSYESEHGEFPPAYTVDENGNRLHSWRTLILPHMDYVSLYESIDLTKPWDDPVNAKAHGTRMDVYMCPSSRQQFGISNYLAVVAPEFLFSGSTPRKLSEVKDGPSSTLMVIEVGHQHAVHWMSPQDVNEDTVFDYDTKNHTNHPGIVQAVFADGHGHAIPLDIDRDVLRSLLTIAGGEDLSDY